MAAGRQPEPMNLTIKHFSLFSIVLHIILLLIPVKTNIFNSDIKSDFINDRNGVLNITLIKNEKVLITQDELNKPIWKFMEEENFEMLVEEFQEQCELPFKIEDEK